MNLARENLSEAVVQRSAVSRVLSQQLAYLCHLHPIPGRGPSQMTTQHPRNQRSLSFSEAEWEVCRWSPPQSVGGAVRARVELPPPKSFRVRLCEEKTIGNKWYAAELNTTQRRKVGVLKEKQKRALIVGKYIIGPEEMTCHGKAEGKVVPKRFAQRMIS